MTRDAGHATSNEGRWEGLGWRVPSLTLYGWPPNDQPTKLLGKRIFRADWSGSWQLQASGKEVISQICIRSTITVISPVVCVLMLEESMARIVLDPRSWESGLDPTFLRRRLP